MQRGIAGTEHPIYFLQISKNPALALGIDSFTGHVIQTQYNVLRRNDDRLAVSGRENVVGRHHQRTRFKLGFQRQRYVYGHLVTIEVSVERRTDQWVQLNRLTFDKYRLKRLDAQTVQCRRAVQHNRMFANNFGQNVPNLGQLALNHFLGRFDRRCHAAQFELAKNERLEQLESHLLRQTALMQTQGRANGNYRTTRVVHALAEQVLAEAALLALDHVSQRLQRTLVRAGNGATTTAVIKQGVYRFLQHALFIAHDDVRSRQVEQALEAVVTVDHPTVQIVQVGSRETTAIQRNKRPKVWR